MNKKKINLRQNFIDIDQRRREMMNNKGLIILLMIALVLSMFIVSCSLNNRISESGEREEETEADENEKKSILATDTPEITPAPTDTPKPIYTLEPTGTIAPTNTPVPLDMRDTLDFSNSSPFTAGSYVLGYIWGGDEYNEYDINFQIHDETTGSYYISDAQHNRYEAYDFTYTYIDDVLTFLLDTGDKLVYTFRPTDNDEIVLRDEATGIDYHFYRPYDELFTAIGSWITVKDDGTLGYVSYWEDGLGYAKNWEDAEHMVTFDWDYAYGVLQCSVHNKQGYFEDVFYDHYGNVAEFIYPRFDYTQVLYRAAGDIMYGYYRLEETDAEEMMITELSLYEEWDAVCTINEDGEAVFCERASWYVNTVDGKIILSTKYKDEYIDMAFEYFYGGDMLILRDKAGYTYSYAKGINPDEIS